MASLTIAFGLVAIPVKLYSATVSSERLRLHLLNAKDGSRLKQQYVCLEEKLQALEEAGTHSVDVARQDCAFVT